jgi:hypothetical protein
MLVVFADVNCSRCKIMLINCNGMTLCNSKSFRASVLMLHGPQVGHPKGPPASPAEMAAAAWYEFPFVTGRRKTAIVMHDYVRLIWQVNDVV